MKKLFLYSLSLALILSCFDTVAQKNKKTVHKKTNAKVAVVHKGPKGKKVIVAKRPRKRAKRTIVVHHHYRHLPRRGALVTSINKSAIVVNFGGFGYRYYSGVWYQPREKKWMVVPVVCFFCQYRSCSSGKRLTPIACEH